MSRLGVCLLLALTATQDPADAGDVSYSFTVEQGWGLSTPFEADFPSVTPRDLDEGLQPLFRPPFVRPIFRRDSSGVPRPRAATPPAAPPPEPPPLPPPPPGTNRGDPLKLEGTITLKASGAFAVSFRRIEYWDRDQRYWIEFDKDKVRANGLGGKDRWSGTRAEWSKRLALVEKAFVGAYLKATTPQAPEEAPRHLGLAAVGPEPGRRLFVTCSIEEQLAAVFLARLDGREIDLKAVPADLEAFPARPARLAQALLERIRAQALGTLVPPEFRSKRDAAVEEAPWIGAEAAVPSFFWDNGHEWAFERLRVVEEARARLRELAGRSVLEFGFDDLTWRRAVEAAAEGVNRTAAVPPLGRTATPADVLAPRAIPGPSPTSDYKDHVSRKEGRLVESRVEVAGLANDVEVYFFHSGVNRWRWTRARLETWYKGRLTRC